MFLLIATYLLALGHVETKHNLTCVALCFFYKIQIVVVSLDIKGFKGSL